jgi:hypothetical protein
VTRRWKDSEISTITKRSLLKWFIGGFGLLLVHHWRRVGGRWNPTLELIMGPSTSPPVLKRRYLGSNLSEPSIH